MSVKVANVALSDTFDTWRVRSNQGFTNLFAITGTKASAINANNVTSGLTTLNANVNITGYIVLSQVWNEERTSKVADVEISVTSAVGGAFTWKLTDTQTSIFLLPTYKYDILLINGSGDKEYWVEGTITMSEGYTTA